jgi:hypothetical protein
LVGKTINLTSENIEINSTSFKVDKDGKITAKSGEIGKFTITSTYLYTGSGST